VPLTRRTITAASRIMLPAYVALTAAFGIVYLTDPFGRLHDVPALAFPREVMQGSMTPWGIVFLGIAAVMSAAFITRSRIWFCFGLSLCAVTFVLWGGMYAVSIGIDSRASVTAPFYPLFVATACVASMTSLLRGER
jgi:hypothetical protein